MRNLSLTVVQELQVKTALSGEPHIDAYRIGKFIESATYPINFLDFEIFNGTIPKEVHIHDYRYDVRALTNRGLRNRVIYVRKSLSKDSTLD